MPTLTPIELATPRLLLRWMDEDDTAAHYAVHADPDVVRYLGRPPWSDLAQAAGSIATTRANYDNGSGLRLAVVLRDSGALIGDVSLFHIFDPGRRCEVGYALGRPHWGRGYACEALRALLDYGFDTLDLNRVEADIDPLNTASARVLDKLGFRQEGYMRERWIVDGVPADSAFYGLLRREWRGGTGSG